MKKFCIYRTTNLVTEKTYSGQHGYENTPFDWYMGSSPSLKKDIKELGKDNFKKSILVFNIDEAHIDQVEKAFIQTELEKGNTYNKQMQGSGNKKTNPGASLYMSNRVVSTETKEKFREKMKDKKGEKALHYGRPHSEETKRRISEKKKGVPSWNDGKKCPQMSEAKRGKYHYTNGVIEVVADTCPEGFWRGGVPKKRRA